MRKNLAVLSFMLVWAILLIAALLWGFQYDWPDFVHVNYGLPLTWATHTISTIAGPADFWNVNISYLLADIVFWLSMVFAGLALILYKAKD
jgi:hypothetical protein